MIRFNAFIKCFIAQNMYSTLSSRKAMGADRIRLVRQNLRNVCRQCEDQIVQYLVERTAVVEQNINTTPRDLEICP